MGTTLYIYGYYTVYLWVLHCIFMGTNFKQKNGCDEAMPTATAIFAKKSKIYKFYKLYKGRTSPLYSGAVLLIFGV